MEWIALGGRKVCRDKSTGNDDDVQRNAVKTVKRKERSQRRIFDYVYTRADENAYGCTSQSALVYVSSVSSLAQSLMVLSCLLVTSSSTGTFYPYTTVYRRSRIRSTYLTNFILRSRRILECSRVVDIAWLFNVGPSRFSWPNFRYRAVNTTYFQLRTRWMMLQKCKHSKWKLYSPSAPAWSIYDSYLTHYRLKHQQLCRSENGKRAKIIH